MKEHLRELRERRLLRKLKDPWQESRAAAREELMRLTGLSERELHLLLEKVTEDALERMAEAHAERDRRNPMPAAMLAEIRNLLEH